LLSAAKLFAFERGGRVIEGYLVIPKEKKAPAVFLYTGTMSAFMKVDFIEVARYSAVRPIMRWTQ
jgi:hypothetical protein